MNFLSIHYNYNWNTSFLADSDFHLSRLGKENTNECRELTCDGIGSHLVPGEVKDSHPLNTTETEVKRWLHGPPGSQMIYLRILVIVIIIIIIIIIDIILLLLF